MEYTLTELGKGVTSRVSELAEWIQDNIHDIIAASDSKRQKLRVRK